MSLRVLAIHLGLLLAFAAWLVSAITFFTLHLEEPSNSAKSILVSEEVSVICHTLGSSIVALIRTPVKKPPAALPTPRAYCTLLALWVKGSANFSGYRLINSIYPQHSAILPRSHCAPFWTRPVDCQHWSFVHHELSLRYDRDLRTRSFEPHIVILLQSYNFDSLAGPFELVFMAFYRSRASGCLHPIHGMVWNIHKRSDQTADSEGAKVFREFLWEWREGKASKW